MHFMDVTDLMDLMDLMGLVDFNQLRVIIRLKCGNVVCSNYRARPTACQTISKRD